MLTGEKRDLTGISGQLAALGKSTSNMRNPKLTLKKSRLWTVLRPPFRATGAKRTCRSGRSGSDANEANPSAPGRDIVPHCAGGRQMVLAGGQRDRAAACAPRGRSLVGLAAFPAILSVAARKHRAAHACLPPGVTLEPVPVKLRRRVPGGLAWPARSLFDWPDRVIEP